MKKIFFIFNTNECSGAEVVSINIIKELKNKYDFYYVSTKGKINNTLKVNSIKWIEISKLSIREIRRIVKEYKPDLVHAVNYKVCTICALSNINVPIIAHLHNNAPWIKYINKKSIAFLYSGLKIKKILTVSESIKKEYIFSRFFSEKFVNVSNPVSRKSILSKVVQNKKIYDICCVARITEPKNPKLFVDIISDLYKKGYHKLKVIWIGEGDLKQEMINYSVEKGLSNIITFLGFKNNPYQLMSESKIFLLSSKWEGYGLVAFEALTLGLPCVVSNVGGLPEIVDNNCGYLCNTNDKSEYVEELNLLLTDETYYNNKCLKALEKSKQLENIDKYILQIEKIYEEIV